MQIEDITTKELQEMVRTASARMTRIVLMETAVAGAMSSVNVLIVEPLAPAESDA